VALAFRVSPFADKADKIDYKNMAAVDGLIAGALLATATARIAQVTLFPFR